MYMPHRWLRLVLLWLPIVFASSVLLSEPVAAQQCTNQDGSQAPIYCTAQCDQTSNTCACDPIQCTGSYSYDGFDNGSDQCAQCPGSQVQRRTITQPDGTTRRWITCSCATNCTAQTKYFACPNGFCKSVCASPTPAPGATPTTPPVVCIPGTCFCASSLDGGPRLSCVPNASCPSNAACCTADNPPGCAEI